MEYSQCMTIVENARKKLAEEIQKENVASRMKVGKSKYNKLKVQSSANLLKNITSSKSSRPFSPELRGNSPKKNDTKSEIGESFILLNSDKLDMSREPLNSKAEGVDDGFNPFLFDSDSKIQNIRDEKTTKDDAGMNGHMQPGKESSKDNQITLIKGQENQRPKENSTKQKVVRRNFVYYDQHCKI